MRGPPKKVRELLDKLRESSLLAVEIYNKPTALFRSGAFIILIIIAWTALLQAIFHKKRVQYYEKHKNGRYVYVDGDKKSWSLERCTTEYFKDSNDPVRKNLEFLIGLRNKIEHRSFPQLDHEIYGECQAALMNLEELLEKEFPKEPKLAQNLVFAIQFSKAPNAQQQVITTKKISRDLASVKAYINRCRSNLTDQDWASQKFSFRLYLIPKVSNNKSANDVAVEFIKLDPNKPEEMKGYEKLQVLIKDRFVEKPVPSSELYPFRVADIVKHVKEKTGKYFSQNIHVGCWKQYNVRSGDKNNPSCNPEYCFFDKLHKDYSYNQKWLDFLTEELKDQQKYDAVYKMAHKTRKPKKP